MPTHVTVGPDVTAPGAPTEKAGSSGRHRPEKKSRSLRLKRSGSLRHGSLRHGSLRSGADEATHADNETATTKVADEYGDEYDDEPRSMVRRVVGAAVSLALLALIAVLIVAVGGTAMGYRAALIRSGSMTPTIEVGAMVVTKPIPATEFKTGDIVTFHSREFGNDLVTHRVVTVERKDNQVNFMTKGDANLVTEKWHVSADTKLGKTLFHVNFVGRVMAAVGDKFVRVGALLIGAVALLSVLMRWILREDDEDDDGDDDGDDVQSGAGPDPANGSAASNAKPTVPAYTSSMPPGAFPPVPPLMRSPMSTPLPIPAATPNPAAPPQVLRADLPPMNEQAYSGTAANLFTPLGTWYPEARPPLEDA